MGPSPPGRYLLADRADYDANSQRLVVCGYARGQGFHPSFRVHLTGAGDFTLHQARGTRDRPALSRKQGLACTIGRRRSVPHFACR